MATTAPSRGRGSRRIAIAIAAGPAGLLLLLIMIVVLLAGGVAVQQQQCGVRAPLPGGFSGPGSLGGVAGTGLTPAQVQSVRTGSPYAGARITDGTYTATAYGPPWGGIQGPGQAMSGGVILNGGAPRLYAIAVDPLVISHGTLVYAWPNPFQWRGPFLAADTGGAINGRHIDFYDWRGRITQTRWGSRSVTVSAEPIKPGGPDVSGSAQPDFAAATDVARDVPGLRGFAVVSEDGETVAEVGATHTNPGRSISKALILVALARRAKARPLTSDERRLSTAMIEQSDNVAATRLYERVGGGAVDVAARAAGMTGWQRNTDDPVYTLGLSTVTAVDFARLFARLDALVPARHRAFARRVLANVQGAGQFGLLRAGLPGEVLSKGGWSPEERGGWTVNQAAQFSLGARRYGVAVTLGDQASFEAGAAQIQRIGEAIVAAPLAGGCGALVASGPLGQRIGQIARSHLGAAASIPGFEPPSFAAAWCGWFATNVWREAGVPIATSGASFWPYDWASARGLLFKRVGQPPRAVTPPAGAALMYGSGPASTATSVHVNVVDSVLDDGSFMVTGGNQDGGRVTRYGPCRLSRTDPAFISGPGCDPRPIYGIAIPGRADA
jgi:3D (Asp-Asp-Asp) domain-containing protein